jgi:drug/metabolite transporter (DMT)-like permease
MIELGVLFAIACALAANLGLLCKHRGACAAPDVRLSQPLRSAASLFRSRWWTIGFGVAFVGWALHVAALSLAPLSLVETVISGGIVLLAWLAERWFGLRVSGREWIGLALIAGGLAFLGLTVPESSSSEHSSYSTAAMIAFESAAVAAGALLLLSGTTGSDRASRGVVLGLAAGLLLGVANVSLKALTGMVDDGVLALLSPWTLAALVAGIGAFFALARGLQVGGAISVIAISSVAANCASILGGVLVFGDSLGGDPLAIIARSAAFAVVIVATALMPAPVGTTAAARA